MGKTIHEALEELDTELWRFYLAVSEDEDGEATDEAADRLARYLKGYFET